MVRAPKPSSSLAARTRWERASAKRSCSPKTHAGDFFGKRPERVGKNESQAAYACRVARPVATKPASGVRYYGRRYYDPKEGRFVGRDPIEEQGGIDLYAFVANNTVNTWDYLGMHTMKPHVVTGTKGKDHTWSSNPFFHGGGGTWDPADYYNPEVLWEAPADFPEDKPKKEEKEKIDTEEDEQIRLSKERCDTLKYLMIKHNEEALDFSKQATAYSNIRDDIFNDYVQPSIYDYSNDILVDSVNTVLSIVPGEERVIFQAVGGLSAGFSDSSGSTETLANAGLVGVTAGLTLTKVTVVGFAGAKIAIVAGVAAGAVNLSATITQAIDDRNQYDELASYWDGQVEMARMTSETNTQLGVAYGKQFSAGGCADYYQ